MKLDNIIEFVKEIRKKNCNDPHSDIGFLMMVKEKQLKKKPTMKKFNVIFYGDTIKELKKNMFIMINNVDEFYEISKKED